ncbi:MAG TPA: ADP-ribosylglycohydrolase family protein, partial [Herpetosiphonaceae bacterium]
MNAIPDSPGGRWRRVLLALDGLSVGDALGGFFEGSGGKGPRRISERQPPAAPWRWTDDTQMALAVAESLRGGAVDQNLLAARLAARDERARGYGLATRSLLGKIRAGADWRGLAPAVFGGTGSWGNGAASRAAPVGAWFADDPAAAAAQAARSSAVTHAHPEA